MLSWLHDIGNQVGYSPDKAQAAVIAILALCLTFCVAGPLTAAIGFLPWKRKP